MIKIECDNSVEKQKNDDNIVYHTLLSDTIYLFDRHDAFTFSTLTIDFTAHSIPMKWKQDYSKVTENHQYLYTTPFVTPKYILGSNDSEPYLIDRENKNYYLWKLQFTFYL